jgi:hypothetical protein
MIRKSTIGTIALTVVTMAIVGIGQSADAFYGTWKLNLAKSQFNTGMPPKSFIVKDEPWEGGIKITGETVDAQGQAIHSEVIAKWDGKDYSRTIDGQVTATRAATRLDGRRYQFVNKVDGKVTNTVTVVVATDGKTRTDTSTGKDAQGQVVDIVRVFDRQ